MIGMDPREPLSLAKEGGRKLLFSSCYCSSVEAADIVTADSVSRSMAKPEGADSPEQELSAGDERLMAESL